jgi:hypothetical protein
MLSGFSLHAITFYTDPEVNFTTTVSPVIVTVLALPDSSGTASVSSEAATISAVLNTPDTFRPTFPSVVNTTSAAGFVAATMSVLPSTPPTLAAVLTTKQTTPIIQSEKNINVSLPRVTSRTIQPEVTLGDARNNSMSSVETDKSGYMDMDEGPELVKERSWNFSNWVTGEGNF